MATKAAENKRLRNTKYNWNTGDIENLIFNHATGAQKNITVEPVIKSIYTANTQVEFGSLIKVAAGTTSYSQICVGKAFSAASTYRIGDIAVEAGSVYVCNVDIPVPHAFTATEWQKVAAETIASIPTTAGAVVCVGKYHNAISVNGFLVDDDSTFGQRR